VAAGSVRILVVEDEANHARILAEILERIGHEVAVATTFERASELLEQERFDIVITDLDLGDRRGTEVLRLARERIPGVEVVVVSGVGDIADAVEAMQLGAAHYFEKPLKMEQVRSIVGQIVERVRSRSAPADTRRSGPSEGLCGMVARSPVMQRVFETIRQVAPTTATVLVRGAPGTGKELVAKAIHELSTRSKGPFVALNCGAISEGLLESELFGHERGAFTGATQTREGKFEYADGGTLFLDEIGDMPLALQVKLLRVVQEREIVRLGSNRTIKVDVRLIAATNRDLDAEIQKGNFRQDLYWRLKVVAIDLPPLQERPEDVPLLVESFLDELAREHGREPLRIDDEAMAVLKANEWPGNVRQLRNAVETMVLLARGPVLGVDDLPAEVQEAGKPRSKALATVDDLAGLTLDQWEKELIRFQLERLEGNRAKVARALGISERTLYRKLKEYGLS